MTRQRTTWTDRTASDPPAIPGYQEKPTHPAAPPADPGKDDYKNGDTSAWAEDPTKGPYKQSEAPAMPGYQEAPTHPAAKRAAMEMRAAMERKASKCIQMAQSMLGRKATASMVEDQALDFMNLSERQIQAALARISTSFLAGDDKPEDKSEDKPEEKKPEAKEAHGPFDVYDINLDDVISIDEWAGSPEIFAALDTDGDGLITRQDVVMGMGESFASGIFSSKKSDQNAPMGPTSGGEAPAVPPMAAAVDEDEAAEKMLAAMLAEEQAPQTEDEGLTVEEKQMLAEMTEEKPVPIAAPIPPPAPVASIEAPMAPVACGVDADPMGLMDVEPTEDDLLALYGMGTPKCAGEKKPEGEPEPEEKKAAEEPEEKTEPEPEPEEDKDASKKEAALRPQPRKPSTGPKTLGAVAKTASGKNEVDELSKLWESAPDVSEVFGR